MSTLGETRYSLLRRLGETSNDEARRQFVGLYEKALYRYVRSKGLQDADAGEVVQQVLLAVHRSVDGWSSSGPGSFRAWLLRVASNQATTVVRRQYRQRMVTGGTTVNEVLKAASSTAHEDAADEEELQWRRWPFVGRRRECNMKSPTRHGKPFGTRRWRVSRRPMWLRN